MIWIWFRISFAYTVLHILITNRTVNIIIFFSLFMNHSYVITTFNIKGGVEFMVYLSYYPTLFEAFISTILSIKIYLLFGQWKIKNSWETLSNEFRENQRNFSAQPKMYFLKKKDKRGAGGSWVCQLFLKFKDDVLRSLRPMIWWLNIQCIMPITIT